MIHKNWTEEFFAKWGFMPISGGAPEDEEKEPEVDPEKEIKDLMEAGEEKEPDGDEPEKPEPDEEKEPEEGEDDDDPKIDPKDDYDISLKDGRKIKYSQLAKLEKQSSSFTKKSQSLSQGMQELKALKDMQSFLAANPEKLKKVLAVIQDVEEAAKEVREEGGTKEEAVDAMAEVFKNLDMKNPVNILIKAMYDGQQKIIKKISETEKKEQLFEKSDKERQFKEQTDKASKALDATFDATFKELKVTDKEESSLIRQMALSFLKDNPKPYTGDDDFKDTISKTIKKMHAVLNKFGEARLSAYLKNKGTNGSRASRAGSGKSKSDEKPETDKEDNLQTTILEALEAQEAGTLGDE